MSRPFPRQVYNYSLLPEVKMALADKAQEMGLTASRLLELIVSGKIPSPFHKSL